jgi:signal transduction histidine kinase
VGVLFMASGNFGRQVALRSLDGPVARPWLWGMASFNVLYLLLTYGYYFSGGSDAGVILIFYGFYTLNCFEYVVSGRRIAATHDPFGSRAVQSAGWLLTVTLGIKTVALLGGWGAADLYEMSWDQGVVFAGQFVAVSILNVGFMQIVVNQIHKAQIRAEHSLAREQERSALLQQHSEDLSELLSEREEIIRQLTLSNKSAGMGALVASIAHELNQPLTTIVLKTELIEAHLRKRADPAAAEAEAQKLAALIRDDTRHAAAIIRTLRSMFATGKGEFGRMDLAALAQDVIHIVRARAERCGIALDVDLNTPLPMTGDVTQLQQVVLNLLNNAIDALVEKPGQPSRIQVKGTLRPGFVDLSITDNGCGIDASQHADVFALFKTSKSQGMGVGLWLSQSIVTSHRGHLGFESEAGQGTVFLLSLPAREYGLTA